MSDHRRRWSNRAFGALLTLYPREFRDEYGREVAMVFADRYRDASGSWGRTLVWIEAMAGVLREAPKEHVHMILQDLRYAVRMARRSPVFTFTAVTTLALGIGANTAIFQMIEAVGLRSLPVSNPGELAEVRIVGGNGGFGVNPGTYEGLTRPVWQELRAHQQAFSGLLAWSTRDFRVGDRSDLRRARGIAVSGEFFQVLGIQPWRGRLIEPSDELETCPSSKAVVSHAYWQRAMGGRDLDRNARLTVDLQFREVIGVTPPGFFGLAVGESFDIALPYCQQKTLRRELFDAIVIGRLRPGWTLDRASAHLDALSPGVFEATAPTGYSARSTETFKAFRLGAYSASTGVSRLRTQYDGSLRLLLAITGLVLLIACANLANLMLARATARDREVAVRLAVGASRIRLLRQFLAESAVLAAGGAALGILLAHQLSRVLVWALSTEDSSPVLVFTTNWRVLLFTAATAAATCIVFGAAPALRTRRIEPAAAMKAGGRILTPGRERLTLRRVMVVTQIAVSLVLVVAALLFVRSFVKLITFDPGMRQADITIAYIGFGPSSAPPEQINTFQRQLLAEVNAIPGVLSAASTTNVPLLGSSWGHGVKIGERDGGSMFTWVSPGYFKTMNTPILQGRDFSLQDTRTSRRVAIVNETFVRRLVADGNPIGKTLITNPEPGFPATEYEIVGVIRDTKYNGLRGDTPPMTFAPDSQFPPVGPWTSMVIHSSLDPATTAASVKRRLTEAHPEVVAEFASFQARIRDGLVRERLLAMLAGFFGVLAAVLAMIGLYGLIAFAAAERRQEIGIRVALGAHRAQITSMMMREAVWLLVAGVGAGAALALAAGRAAGTLLFGLEPHDPPTLAAACVLLAAIASVATFLPARAAARLDPLTALRQE